MTQRLVSLKGSTISHLYKLNGVILIFNFTLVHEFKKNNFGYVFEWTKVDWLINFTNVNNIMETSSSSKVVTLEFVNWARATISEPITFAYASKFRKLRLMKLTQFSHFLGHNTWHERIGCIIYSTWQQIIELKNSLHRSNTRPPRHQHEWTY